MTVSTNSSNLPRVAIVADTRTFASSICSMVQSEAHTQGAEFVYELFGMDEADGVSPAVHRLQLNSEGTVSVQCNPDGLAQYGQELAPTDTRRGHFETVGTYDQVFLGLTPDTLFKEGDPDLRGLHSAPLGVHHFLDREVNRVRVGKSTRARVDCEPQVPASEFPSQFAVNAQGQLLPTVTLPSGERNVMTDRPLPIYPVGGVAVDEHGAILDDDMTSFHRAIRGLVTVAAGTTSKVLPAEEVAARRSAAVEALAARSVGVAPTRRACELT